MDNINKHRLLDKIIHSREMTALEKRYLEKLVRNDIPHWIEDEYGFFHCSVCGWEFDEPEWTEPKCPNCRAKMENHRLGKFYERR